MTKMSYSEVSKAVKTIFAMNTANEVIQYSIKVSMSDIDRKAKRYLNKALDAQLSSLKANEFLGIFAEGSLFKGGDIDREEKL